MGRDKALLEVGGVALARRVADALAAAGAQPVVAIGGDTLALGRLGLVAVADRWPGEGPLGGVVHALELLGERDGEPAIVAVLACDLLAPDPAAVRTVVRAVMASGADVAAPHVDGRLQFHHAAWHVRALPRLHRAFAAGVRAMHNAARELAVVPVADVGPDAVRDADRPEDLPDPSG
jgi:molybdopterin-guanine dinucleotide biosynthesis protein A